MLAFEIHRVGARFSHATVPGFPMERCYTTGYAIYAIFPNLFCLIKLRKLHKLCNRASLPREALASNKKIFACHIRESKHISKQLRDTKIFQISPTAIP